eukprot:scaffold41422_cov63-Phaeocystis_antarctica.AAC.4
MHRAAPHLALGATVRVRASGRNSRRGAAAASAAHDAGREVVVVIRGIAGRRDAAHLHKVQGSKVRVRARGGEGGGDGDRARVVAVRLATS